MVQSILIVGVGGQGTLLASRILGYTMGKQGYDVKVSEVHGMSQRGGSVVTYVKYGEQVYSPVIGYGEADIILSFEQLEAARYLPYLKPNGIIVTNTQKIDPMPVITGAQTYPEHILSQMKQAGIRILAVDALMLAERAGSVKAVNVALIGAMARQTNVGYEVWMDALTHCIPSKFIEMNRKAFEFGYHDHAE